MIFSSLPSTADEIQRDVYYEKPTCLWSVRWQVLLVDINYFELPCSTWHSAQSIDMSVSIPPLKRGFLWSLSWFRDLQSSIQVWWNSTSIQWPVVRRERSGARGIHIPYIFPIQCGAKNLPNNWRLAWTSQHGMGPAIVRLVAVASLFGISHRDRNCKSSSEW